MIENTGRRVVAWASVSMDGYTSGPGGPAHDQGLYDHARQEQPSATSRASGEAPAPRCSAAKPRRVLLRVAGHHPGPAHAARVRDLGAGLPFFDKDATKITYDLWHGYRKLERDDITPAFPFRFGLGYTTFALSNLCLGHDTISVDDTVVATLDVTNTGDQTGEEVVQLYVGARGSTVERAPRSSRPSPGSHWPRRHADRPPRCARRQPRVLRRLSRLDRRDRRLRTDRRRHALDDRALHAKLAIH